MASVDEMSARLAELVRSLYGEGFIPLHRPIFEGSEKKYLAECVDSNFVSSVGEKVTELERRVARFAGAHHGVATVNGTAALHAGLVVAGVAPDEEVITQALTFVATCNAITYTGARPVFVDVDRDTMGMSPGALEGFLAQNAQRSSDGRCMNRHTGRRIAACLPVHTFGHPCRVDSLVQLCAEYGVPLIEDAAESLGSYVAGRHTGTVGLLGTLSFNGNKIITTGGGGMIITDDAAVAERARHLTTTARLPHRWDYAHDEVGFNYRLPNINAALGCAQIERLPEFLAAKAEVSRAYEHFFHKESPEFVTARAGTTANYWLNAVRMGSAKDRDELLRFTNERDIMTRPMWKLMPELPMYQHCWHDGLVESRWLAERIVNLPSSVPAGALAVKSRSPR